MVGAASATSAAAVAVGSNVNANGFDEAVVAASLVVSLSAAASPAGSESVKGADIAATEPSASRALAMIS